MIPYFEQPSFSVGPLTIYAFGIFAALGILLGSTLAARAAQRYSGLDAQPLKQAVPWAVIGGVLGGHLLHVFGYHPEMLSQRGALVILEVWNGQSSMGGALGGLLGFIAWFKRRDLALLPYLDALALGVAPGWALARVGCFLAHDHPGSRTNFFLGVAFPGGARHDLGLYEALVLAAIAALVYWMARRPRPSGVLMGVLAGIYGVSRFALDFLRATDVANADGRILGLTPAQYMAMAMVGAAAWLFARGAVLGRRMLEREQNS